MTNFRPGDILRWNDNPKLFYVITSTDETKISVMCYHTTETFGPYTFPLDDDYSNFTLERAKAPCFQKLYEKLL